MKSRRRRIMRSIVKVFYLIKVLLNNGERERKKTKNPNDILETLKQAKRHAYICSTVTTTHY